MAQFEEYNNPWSAENSEWYNEGNDRWYNNNEFGIKVANSTQNQTSKIGSALICYGLGAELVNFKVFSDALKKNHLTNKYDSANIEIVKTKTRIDLLDAIINSGLSNIKELHIFSHSIGGGLFLGYHDQTLNNNRETFIKNNPNYTYDDVLIHEIGGLLTDHLIVTLQSEKNTIRKILKDLDFIKLWGCNAGITNWVYSGVYWGKLNDKNTPKPSIAKALAEYTNQNVYGATSGSHIEYFIKGKWVSGYDYPKKYGKKFPNYKEYTDIRLHPDKGVYNKYTP